MKRDVDLQRLILLFIEKHCPPQGGLNKSVEIANYEEVVINAHLELLIEDRLVDGKVLKGLGPEGSQVMVLRLTTLGHDAIDAARNDTLWQKAKKKVADSGVAITLSTVVALLKLEAKKHLHLP